MTDEAQKTSPEMEPEERIRAAIFSGDDEQIAQACRGNERYLHAFSDEERKRIALAFERVQVLAELRAVFARQSPDEIVRVYSKHADILEGCRNFGREERQRVVQAKRALLLRDLELAMRVGDIFWIERAGRSAAEGGCQLSQEQYLAIERARQTITALRQLQQAIQEDDDVAIVQAYNPELLDDCRQVTAQEMKRVRQAQDRLRRWQLLRLALAREDDRRIASLYDPVLFGQFKPMSAEQRARCELAVQRIRAYERLQQAFQTGDPQHIVDAYDPELLDLSPLLTAQQRRRVEEARYQVLMLKAWKSGDIERIVDAYQALRQAHVNLPAGVDREALMEAEQLSELLEQFRAALRYPIANDEEIVRLGERLLERFPDLLTPEERKRVTDAKIRLGARSRLLWATTSGDDMRITLVRQHLSSLVASRHGRE
ncbi:MAG: hypothetical protein ACP5R2_07675 [Anaerolineae bacterium]